MQHQNRSDENHFKREKIEKKDKVKRLCANLQKERDRSTRNKEL